MTNWQRTCKCVKCVLVELRHAIENLVRVQVFVQDVQQGLHDGAEPVVKKPTLVLKALQQPLPVVRCKVTARSSAEQRNMMRYLQMQSVMRSN